MVAPLTPPEADLQDFPFMPLHVARLRDSDLAAEEAPEACWYAVLLWAASWHQLPAGSLPDNDTVLMRLCGLGRDVRTWKKHRAGAMRGFVLCDDGRLYHPVVAEQVIAAWDSKLRQRHRTFCATIRKHNERNAEDRRDAPAFDYWMSLSCPENLSEYVTAMSRVTGANSERDMGSKGQREGQGQGDSDTDADASGAASPKPAPPSPLDLKAGVFGAGVPFLTGTGIAIDKARAMLGKWRRDFGDGAVIDALAAAHAEAASDPIPYITACLGGSNGKRTQHRAQQGSRRERPSAWAPQPGFDGFEPASLDDD